MCLFARTLTIIRLTIQTPRHLFSIDYARDDCASSAVDYEGPTPGSTGDIRLSAEAQELGGEVEPLHRSAQNLEVPDLAPGH